MRDQVVLHRVKDDLLGYGYLLFMLCQQHVISWINNLVVNKVLMYL